MQVLIQKYLHILVIFERLCYNMIKENAVWIELPINILYRFSIKSGQFIFSPAGGGGK